MILLTVVFGVLAAVFGHESTSTAGMIAFAIRCLFFLATLPGPGTSIISKLITRARLSHQIAEGCCWMIPEATAQHRPDKKRGSTSNGDRGPRGLITGGEFALDGNDGA